MVAVCQRESEQLLVKIWVKTGLRNGELFALRWDHIDLDMGVVSVSDNYVTHVGELCTPKTEAGERDILLDNETIGYFIQLKAITDSKSTIVFQNPRSKFKNAQWDNYYLRRLFQRLFKIADVPSRKIYNIRHTYATIRISQGHNLWDIAVQMGHESPEMLYQTYGDFIAEYQELQTKNDTKTHIGRTARNETSIFH